MASTELDPLFVKGLRLLHSKSKDSADQLKQLLDDVIAQSKHSVHIKERTYSSVKQESESKLLLKKTSRDICEPSNLSLKLIPDERDRKPEKRPFEKIKPDITESLHDSKIPKLESPQVFPCYPPSPDIPKLEQFIPRKDDDTDSSDENADADDFAMGMGLACIICKQIDVTQGNQLIECQECHSLYHQECHKPPATDYDVNDPRRVWYCAKCMKNMKKMATKTQKTTKTTVVVTTKEPASQTRCSKPETTAPSLMLPFKRTELKAPISQGNNQSSNNKPIGLAGLAANLSGRSTTTPSSTTVSSTSRAPGSKSSGPGLGLKAFNTFASHASTISKTSGISSSTSSTSKMTTSSSIFPTLSSMTSTSPSSSLSSSVPKSSGSSPLSTTKTGLGLLSTAATSTASRTIPTSSNNGNSGHTKVASCSPLMNADKRVQIMKKKAAKLHEKRRLSTK